MSPKDAERFDEMTRSLFPDAYRRCPAFMRHKDVLISPKLLRHHGIPFMQVRFDLGLGWVRGCTCANAQSLGVWL